MDARNIGEELFANVVNGSRSSECLDYSVYIELIHGHEVIKVILVIVSRDGRLGGTS